MVVSTEYSVVTVYLLSPTSSFSIPSFFSLSEFLSLTIFFSFSFSLLLSFPPSRHLHLFRFFAISLGFSPIPPFLFLPFLLGTKDNSLLKSHPRISHALRLSLLLILPSGLLVSDFLALFKSIL